MKRARVTTGEVRKYRGRSRSRAIVEARRGSEDYTIVGRLAGRIYVVGKQRARQGR